MHARSILAAVGAVTLAAGGAAAQTVFSDDFSPAESLLWGNQRGNWSATSGVYSAGLPNNNPLTLSSVPYEFADCEVSVDFNACTDGGIWLHADATGQTGLLLVLAHGNIYWHPIVGGSPASTSPQVSAFSPGQNVNVRVTVVGSTYSAYLNGSTTPITTYTTAAYPSGRIGLYDFASPGNTYDNFVVSGVCASGTCCALVSKNPSPRLTCPGGTTTLSVVGAGTAVSYRWHKRVGGNGVPLSDGATGLGSTIAGSSTAAMTISACAAGDAGDYYCVVSNGCGGQNSADAHLTVSCPNLADVAGLGGSVGCDGQLTADDLIVFLDALFAGNLAVADIAGLGGSAGADGQITTDDLIRFLDQFFTPCS